MLKRLIKHFIALCVVYLAAGLASAAPTGFTGYYDYSTWTAVQTLGGTPVSDISLDRQTLTLYEPNDPFLPYAPQELRFSHSVQASGNLSFDWIFDVGLDTCCAGFNFYVNDTLYKLANGNFEDPFNWTAPELGGSFSVLVNAGDTITFGVFSAEAKGFASLGTIVNFNALDRASAQTPEPGTLALFGLGLLGIVRLRRQPR